MSGIDPRQVRRTAPPQRGPAEAEPPHLEPPDAVTVQIGAPIESMDPEPQERPMRHAHIATAPEDGPRAVVYVMCGGCSNMIGVPVGIHFNCPGCNRPYFYTAVA